MLVYAPGTKSGELHMVSILQLLKLSHYTVGVESSNENQRVDGVDCSGADGWHLLPMLSSCKRKGDDPNAHKTMRASEGDLTSSTLGDKLADALERTRKLLARHKSDRNNSEAVLFLGMDSPELPMEEIIYGLQISSGNSTARQSKHSDIKENDNCQGMTHDVFVGKAHMCPANDGGYGLLSVPKHAPSSRIFSGVRWSNPLTAVSQLKALTDSNVAVSVGRIAARLVCSRNNDNKIMASTRQEMDVLSDFASGISVYLHSDTSKDCPLTWKALVDLNVVHTTDKECGGVSETTYSVKNEFTLVK